MAIGLDWVIYDEESMELCGFGSSHDSALQDACERAFVSGDFDAESWDDVDFDIDASEIVPTWVAATQERFREAFEESIAAALGD